MNENLSTLIQETPSEEAMRFDPNNLELSQEEAATDETITAESLPVEPSEETTVEEAAETTEAAPENVEVAAETPTAEIPIISFGEWFATYSTDFASIHQSRISIPGVDPNEYLMVSIDDPDGIESQPGVRKRSLRLFDDALTQPVLNMAPSDLQIYKNGFRTIYPLNDETYIKMYGVKTGLIAMFCHSLDNSLIPFSKIVAKRKDLFINIQTNNIEGYREQLLQTIDMEALHLLYRQSMKAGVFATKGAAIHWLLTRQDAITDINHHLLIDKVVMSLLSS